MKPVPLKLNLGCGKDWKAGAINIDFRMLDTPQGYSFLRADVSDLEHYFEPESADEIWALDILEHIPRPLVKQTVESWIRLLRPEGVLHVKTPDLALLAEKVLDPNVPDDHAAWLIYGEQAHIGAYHKSGFTEAMLRRILTDAGLKIVKLSRYQQETNIYVRAVKNGDSGSSDEDVHDTQAS